MQQIRQSPRPFPFQLRLNAPPSSSRISGDRHVPESVNFQRFIRYRPPSKLIRAYGAPQYAFAPDSRLKNSPDKTDELDARTFRIPIPYNCRAIKPLAHTAAQGNHPMRATSNLSAAVSGRHVPSPKPFPFRFSRFSLCAWQRPLPTPSYFLSARRILPMRRVFLQAKFSKSKRHQSCSFTFLPQRIIYFEDMLTFGYSYDILCKEAGRGAFPQERILF